MRVDERERDPIHRRVDRLVAALERLIHAADGDREEGRELGLHRVRDGHVAPAEDDVSVLIADVEERRAVRRRRELHVGVLAHRGDLVLSALGLQRIEQEF